MLKFALAYATRGWSVFPLNGKVPLTKHGFKDATKDPDQIAKWWKKWPDADIGIATGMVSGIAVLDIDEKPNHNPPVSGSATLAAMSLTPPESLTSQTGGGGRHVFMVCDSPMQSANGWAEGLDFKADGGYIVAPPSKHANGTHYRWLVNASLARLPGWLPPVRTETALAVPKEDFPPADSATLEAALAYLTNHHGPAIQGKGGDDHTFQVGAILLNDFALTFKEAWPIACRWNATCQPPWSAGSLAKKVENGISYARGPYGELRRNPLVTEWTVPDLDSAIAPFVPPEQKDEFEHCATDLGNAYLLARVFKDRLRYVTDWGKWLVWNDKCWAPDATNEAMRSCHEVVRAMGDDADKALKKGNDLQSKFNKANLAALAFGTQTIEQQQALDILKTQAEQALGAAVALGKRYTKAQANTALQAMLKQAGTLPNIAISSALLDRDTMLLSCDNGTLDLRTGSLQPHSRKDLITKCVPVAFDATATAPQWEAFLSQCMLGDESLTAYLQRAVGYSLTGDVTEHGFFFMQGDGQNGKSTFITTLQAMLGPYSVQAAPDLLLKKMNRHDSDTSNLPGVRFLVHGEPGRGRSFDDAIIKQLTGGDNISGRFMGKERFEFAPTHKIWICSNPMPNIDGQDHGMWRRVKLIKWNLKLAPGEADPDLSRKLRAELPGVLAWAVKGCAEWRRIGLADPPAVVEEVKKYKHQEDSFREFLADTCESSPGCFLPRSDLYLAYRTWAEDNGLRAASAKNFTPEVRRLLGANAEHMHVGTRGWLGIKRKGEEAVRISIGGMQNGHG